MDEHKNIDIASQESKRLLSLLIKRGIELGLPDVPVARFEFACCLILLASYLAALGKEMAVCNKIVDYVAQNRDLLIESPAYSEDELKELLSYRKSLYAVPNIASISYSLNKLIEQATKYGHFVRLESIGKSQVPENKSEQVKIYMALMKIMQDEHLSSLAYILFVLSDPITVFCRVTGIADSVIIESEDCDSTIGGARHGDVAVTTFSPLLKKKEIHQSEVIENVPSQRNSDDIAFNTFHQNNKGKPTSTRKLRTPFIGQILMNGVAKSKGDKLAEVTNFSENKSHFNLSSYLAIATLILAVMALCAMWASSVRKVNRQNPIKATNVAVIDEALPTASDVSTRSQMPKVKKITKIQAQNDLWNAVFASDEIAARKAVMNGADVNAWKIEGGNKYAALQYSVSQSDYDMTKWLIDNGADVFVKTDEFENLWSIIIRKGKSQYGEDIIILLMEHGLDANVPGRLELDDNLKSYMVGMAGTEVGKEFVTEAFSEHDLKNTIRERINEIIKDEKIVIPIMAHCASHGYTKAVQFMLDRGVKPDCDVTSVMGGPLFYAAYNGHSQIVDMLLKKGARVDEVQIFGGITPLHVAVGKGNCVIVESLVRHGASLSMETPAGATAMHLAALSGNLSVIELLIRHGASVNIKAQNTGFSPLRFALEYKQFSAAQYLIDHGSSLTEPDEEGITDGMMIVMLAEDEDPMWRSLLTDRQCNQALHEWQAWDKSKE